MIKLRKGIKPQILTDRKQEWDRDLEAALSSGDRERIRTATKRYNHPSVKAALKQETHEKCAYCEGKVTDVAHGDIEHVTAKSVDRALTFEWSNLTFSCQICNQKKSDKDNIIDPYNEDPTSHIFFLGPFVKGKSEKGIGTVVELDLNRVALIESRNREIERYAGELEKVFLIADPKIKQLLFQGMVDSLDGGQPEFSAACQSALRKYQDEVS